VSYTSLRCWLPEATLRLMTSLLLHSLVRLRTTQRCHWAPKSRMIQNSSLSCCIERFEGLALTDLGPKSLKKIATSLNFLLTRYCCLSVCLLENVDSLRALTYALSRNSAEQRPGSLYLRMWTSRGCYWARSSQKCMSLLLSCDCCTRQKRCSKNHLRPS